MKLLILGTLGLLSIAAHAASFSCTETTHQYASQFSVVTIGNQLSLSSSGDIEQVIPSQKMSLDKTYKPRAKNEGSLRYLGEDNMGSFELYMNKQMASAQSGYMTLKTYANSDGGAPASLYFFCTKK